MFPALRYSVDGLDSNADYKVYIDILPADANKYRYIYHSSKWMVAGCGEIPVQSQKCEYSGGYVKGSSTEARVLSFEKLKLTNCCISRKTQISLSSMQLYQPRLHIEKIPRSDNMANEYFMTSFPQTCFMAVTAYQNQRITKMKIARNPFAKGFREACKKRTSLEDLFCKIKDGGKTTSRKKHTTCEKDEDDSSRKCSKNKKRLSNAEGLAITSEVISEAKHEQSRTLPFSVPIPQACRLAFSREYLRGDRCRNSVPLKLLVTHNMTVNVPSVQTIPHCCVNSVYHSGISPMKDYSRTLFGHVGNNSMPFCEYDYQNCNTNCPAIGLPH